MRFALNEVNPTALDDSTKGLLVGQPKSAAPRRRLSIPAPLIALLERHLSDRGPRPRDVTLSRPRVAKLADLRKVVGQRGAAGPIEPQLDGRLGLGVPRRDDRARARECELSNSARAGGDPLRRCVGSRAVQTFLFADLAGFTALTESHGDEQGADLAADFCAAVRSLLPQDAEVVKNIGDAVMVRCPQAAEAVPLGLRIVCEGGAQHGFPVIRVGMHTGPAVERQGDWFGTAVNVAARVSGRAAGGEMLLSERTREAAGSVPDVQLVDHGWVDLRNVAEPVHLYAARWADAADSAPYPSIRCAGWQWSRRAAPAAWSTRAATTPSARSSALLGSLGAGPLCHAPAARTRRWLWSSVDPDTRHGA